MDREKPLSVTQAKAALLATAAPPEKAMRHSVGPSAHPWPWLAAAAGVGLVVGMYPRVTRTLAPVVARGIIAVILK